MVEADGAAREGPVGQAKCRCRSTSRRNGIRGLVGLSRNQIEAFHWQPDAPRFQAGFETMRVREHVAKVAELRRKIREADESIAEWELGDHWDQAQFELGKVRLFGDLVLAAFFE